MGPPSWSSIWQQSSFSQKQASLKSATCTREPEICHKVLNPFKTNFHPRAHHTIYKFPPPLTFIRKIPSFQSYLAPDQAHLLLLAMKLISTAAAFSPPYSSIYSTGIFNFITCTNEPKLCHRINNHYNSNLIIPRKIPFQILQSLSPEHLLPLKTKLT